MDEDEEVTDELIENFFNDMAPVAEIMVNQHSLDVITNMAVVTLLAGRLLACIQSREHIETANILLALSEAIKHHPQCYIDMETKLVGVWRELYKEEYADYLFDTEGDNDVMD